MHPLAQVETVGIESLDAGVEFQLGAALRAGFLHEPREQRAAMSLGALRRVGVLSYVVKGAKLDTNLQLSSGAYQIIVEEWDNCGGSSTSQLPLRVRNGNVQLSSPSANAGPAVATMSTGPDSAPRCK